MDLDSFLFPRDHWFLWVCLSDLVSFDRLSDVVFWAFFFLVVIGAEDVGEFGLILCATSVTAVWCEPSASPGVVCSSCKSAPLDDAVAVGEVM